MLLRNSRFPFHLQRLKIFLQHPQHSSDHEQKLENFRVLLHHDVVQHDIERPSDFVVQRKTRQRFWIRRLKNSMTSNNRKVRY